MSILLSSVAPGELGARAGGVGGGRWQQLGRFPRSGRWHGGQPLGGDNPRAARRHSQHRVSQSASPVASRDVSVKLEGVIQGPGDPEALGRPGMAWDGLGGRNAAHHLLSPET